MDAVEESVQMPHCASVSGYSAQRCARDQKDAMRCDLVCRDQQPLPEMAIPSQGSPPNICSMLVMLESLAEWLSV